MQITIKGLGLVKDASEATAAIEAGIAKRIAGGTFVSIQILEAAGLVRELADPRATATVDLDLLATTKPAQRTVPTHKPSRHLCHYCGQPVSNDQGFFGEPTCDNCR